MMVDGRYLIVGVINTACVISTLFYIIAHHQHTIETIKHEAPTINSLIYSHCDGVIGLEEAVEEVFRKTQHA